MEKFLKENKNYLIIGVVLYLVFKLRNIFLPAGGIITSVLDTVQVKADAANATANAKAANQKASAQVSLDKSKSVVLNKATALDIENYRSDALAIATALGTRPTGFFGGIVDSGSYNEDEQAAFNVLKKYTKFIIRNGKAVMPRDAKYRVAALEPFYKEVTNGRGLKADVYKYLTEEPYRSLLSTIW
jgi:hypothetical protein